MDKELFNYWNLEKQRLDEENPQDTFINPREFWYTKMGQNIGFEENGKKDFVRPVLVIKKIGNLFFTVALTTKGKSTHFYHKFEKIKLDKEQRKHSKSSFAVLSQVRVMDKRRFLNKIGIVEEEEFEVVKQKLTTLLL